MFTLFALLFSNPVMAEDCDAKQLKKDIAEASPVSVPRIYLKLVDCDADAANDSAEDTLARVLHGDEGNQAALAALKVGAQRQVMEWVDNLEPDQRSQTMLWLGDQCSEVDTIGQFFVDSASEMREPFIKERWYRGMAKCRTAEG